MTPSTTLIHDFPARLISSVQSEAYWHLAEAYRYLCAGFPCYGTRQEMRDNIDARLLITSLRDAVLADSFPFYEGTLIDSLTGIVQVAEKGGRQ